MRFVENRIGTVFQVKQLREDLYFFKALRHGCKPLSRGKQDE